MRKGISTILTVAITVIVMLFLAAGGWYYMDKSGKDAKKVSDDQIASLQAQITKLQKDATPVTADSSETATNTNTSGETDPNINLARTRATEFEKLNSQQNAQSSALLAFFSPAATPTEVSFYGFLTGADAAAPRLKATATFSYTLSSFAIDDVTKSGTKYIANVTENRLVQSSNGSDTQIAKQQHKKIEFLLSSANILMIDKYYSAGVTGDIPSTTGGDATAQKYEGFYTD